LKWCTSPLKITYKCTVCIQYFVYRYYVQVLLIDEEPMYPHAVECLLCSTFERGVPKSRQVDGSLGAGSKARRCDLAMPARFCSPRQIMALAGGQVPSCSYFMDQNNCKLHDNDRMLSRVIVCWLEYCDVVVTSSSGISAAGLRAIPEGSSCRPFSVRLGDFLNNISSSPLRTSANFSSMFL